MPEGLTLARQMLRLGLLYLQSNQQRCNLQPILRVPFFAAVDHAMRKFNKKQFCVESCSMERTVTKSHVGARNKAAFRLVVPLIFLSPLEMNSAATNVLPLQSHVRKQVGHLCRQTRASTHLPVGILTIAFSSLISSTTFFWYCLSLLRGNNMLVYFRRSLDQNCM